MIPEPVLDPSARNEILADAAVERDAANAQRNQIAIELDASKVSLNAVRQQILNELAEDREAIRSAVDVLKILADLAVAAVQQAEVVKLTQTRQHIERLYQNREAGYLKEQQEGEQFVLNAQSILEKAAQEWNDLRLKAQSALEQADQDQLRFRNLALAREQQRFQEHIDRWQRDLEDLRSKGEAIDGKELLARIQLVLDFAGFIPVLGAGPDLINTIISAGQGNWGEAAINAIAIIPFWGDGVKAGKMLVKAGQEGVQHVDEVAGVVNAVAKNGDTADEVLQAGGEVLEYVDAGLAIADDIAERLLRELSLNDDAQRALLRKALNQAGTGKSAHHIIPLEAIGKYRSLLEQAARGGFNMNGKENGILLKQGVDHIGGHRGYNKALLAELERIAQEAKQHGLTNSEVAERLQGLANLFGDAIKNGTFGPWF